MSLRQWTLGTNPTAVAPRGIIVLESGCETIAHTFLDLLLDGADLPKLLQELTSAYAAELSSLPAFVAIIEDGQSAHIAVRGAFELVVDTPEGPRSLSSGSVITWSEHRLTGVRGWRISGIVEDGHDHDAQWVIDTGVVPLTTLRSGDVGHVIAEEPIVDNALAISNDADGGADNRRGADEGGEITVLPAAADDIDSEKRQRGGVIPKPKHAKVDSDKPQAPTHLPGATTSAEDGENSTPQTTPMAALKAPESASVEPLTETRLPETEATRTGDDLDFTYAEPQEPLAVYPRDEVPETSKYDELVDHTRMQPVEMAAVRDVRNSDADEDPHIEAPQSEHPAQSHTAPPDNAPLSFGHLSGARDRQLPSPANPLAFRGAPTKDTSATPLGFSAATGTPPTLSTPAAVSPSVAMPSPATPPVPAQGFFIDEVPGAASKPEQPWQQMATASPQHVPTAAHATDEQQEGDHDGHTVMGARAQALREQARKLAGVAASTGQSDGPQVLAVLCTAGHPNPTYATTCRSCGGPLSNHSTTVSRPKLGTLVFSTGEVLPLDRDVVVGRRPTFKAEPGRPEAHIVPVPSPQQQISRTHCHIRVDDWEVRVRDMASNNGTYLTKPGETPIRLSEHTPMILQVGDVIDLGEGVTIRMEA